MSNAEAIAMITNLQVRINELEVNDLELLGRIQRLEAARSAPQSSLVESVEAAITNPLTDTNTDACAAILAVADWLQDRFDSYGGRGTPRAAHLIQWLRQEVKA